MLFWKTKSLIRLLQAGEHDGLHDEEGRRSRRGCPPPWRAGPGQREPERSSARGSLLGSAPSCWTCPRALRSMTLLKRLLLRTRPAGTGERKSGRSRTLLLELQPFLLRPRLCCLSLLRGERGGSNRRTERTQIVPSRACGEKTEAQVMFPAGLTTVPQPRSRCEPSFSYKN
jgi:hypothetical protein